VTTFPVFLDVSSRPPLVLGGGETALTKARLLARRAPLTQVAAETLGSHWDELVLQGRVERIDARASVALLRGRPLVIAAMEDDAANADVAAMCRALGVPVNVPDKPDLCTFYLPAIVDRAPVTLAIGTDGASPVLAQKLRTWLERELHPRLGRLAEILAEFRPRAATALSHGSARRRFWERIVDGQAGRAILDGDENDGRAQIAAALNEQAAGHTPPGRVLLVGAGPGDAELLTLKAVRALKSADVILYDDLVGADVLGYARRECKMIYVGKRGGRRNISQDAINEAILAHLQPGLTVVRLKGGDPFVFGRGGEEVAALRAAGVEVEVIPGISAAFAGAAAAQIPLTDRRFSRSVTFLSGHGAGDGACDMRHADLGALKDGGHTLAIYMGVRNASAIAATLLEAGWRPDTPVLALENVALPQQRSLLCCLADMAARIGASGMHGPAILYIGDVVHASTQAQQGQSSEERRDPFAALSLAS